MERATRHASSFDSSGRAPFLPSQTPKSSSIRSTCEAVSSSPIR